MKVDAQKWGQCPYKISPGEIPPCPCHEQTVKRWPSENHGGGLTRHSTCQHFDLGLPTSVVDMPPSLWHSCHSSLNGLRHTLDVWDVTLHSTHPTSLTTSWWLLALYLSLRGQFLQSWPHFTHSSWSVSSIFTFVLTSLW